MSRRNAIASMRRLSTAPARRPRTLPASKQPPLSFDENLALRQRHLAPALKAHYKESSKGPLKLAHGSGQYLYDTEGNSFLDCVNNVCHVGHCHPRVVQARPPATSHHTACPHPTVAPS